jgi:predicted Zn-dependent protease with MMP-like domain
VRKGSRSFTKKIKKNNDLPWEELFKRADDTVRQIVSELPKEVQAHAKKIPYILEKWHPSPKSHTTLILGTYHGFVSDRLSDQHGPIFLYLGDIYQYCSENQKNFEKEVRTTWLHEFGHYVGWDEDKVRAHDL